MVEEKKQTGNGAGAGELENPGNGEAGAEQVVNGETEVVEAVADAEAGEGAKEGENNEDVTRADDTKADEVANLLQENERLKMEVQENIDKALRANRGTG